MSCTICRTDLIELFYVKNYCVFLRILKYLLIGLVNGSSGASFFKSSRRGPKFNKDEPFSSAFGCKII